MGAPFEVTVTPEGSTVTMMLRGELDLATAPRLRDACAEALRDQPDTLRIDMNDLTFIDSSGISVLVQAQHDLEQRGASLVLHRVGDHTARVLEIAGLGEFFARSDQSVE